MRERTWTRRTSRARVFVVDDAKRAAGSGRVAHRAHDILSLTTQNARQECDAAYIERWTFRSSAMRNGRLCGARHTSRTGLFVADGAKCAAGPGRGARRARKRATSLPPKRSLGRGARESQLQFLPALSLMLRMGGWEWAGTSGSFELARSTPPPPPGSRWGGGVGGGARVVGTSKVVQEGPR